MLLNIITLRRGFSRESKGFWVHLPVGLIIVALACLDISIGGVGLMGGMLTYLFVRYEVTQGGDPHKDIIGAAFGVGLGAAGLFLYLVLGGTI